MSAINNTIEYQYNQSLAELKALLIRYNQTINWSGDNSNDSNHDVAAMVIGIIALCVSVIAIVLIVVLFAKRK